MPMAIETKMKRFKKAQEKLLMMKEKIYENINYQLMTKNDVVNFIEAEVPLDREHMYCVFLNAKNTIITYHKVSEGTLTQSLCYPREILKSAIELGALSIILVHNHPSGMVEPSTSDIKSTKIMYFAGRVMDITLLDHVIIGAGKRYSFMDQGKIAKYQAEYYETFTSNLG